MYERTIGLLANDVGVTTANTTNLGEGVHDLLLTTNVGVCIETLDRRFHQSSVSTSSVGREGRKGIVTGVGVVDVLRSRRMNWKFAVRCQVSNLILDC